MTAEQLRNSILQEAISGRLVPQDPNDEPASVLLEKIRAEKARLIKEGKLKKEKPSAPITDDEKPFEIPESWEWCRIQDVQYLLTDGTHNRPQYVDKGVPFISVKDISSGRLNLSHTKFISQADHAILSKRCNPKYGDLLISKVGTTGVPVLVDTHEEFSLFVSVALIKYFAQYTLSKYLIYLINSPLVQEQIKEHTRGVGNKNWVLNDIYNTIIVLPPLAEQKRIVAKLEELLPIVEQYGKAQSELDELNAALPARLRQSILQEAISGKLVPQDERDEPAYLFLERLQNIKEGLVKQKILKKDALSFGVVKEEDIPFEIPANWEWRYLGDLVYLISGTSYKKDDVCNNGIRILRGGNIVNDKLILADDDVFLSEEYRSEEKNIKPNDIVIVASTGSKKVIGKPALVQEPIADTQIGAFLRIVRPIDAAYVPYLWTLFRSEYYRGHIRDLVKGTNINNIKEEYLTYMPIPLPPLAEQQRIVAKIEELFEQIDKISK